MCGQASLEPMCAHCSAVLTRKACLWPAAGVACVRGGVDEQAAIRIWDAADWRAKGVLEGSVAYVADARVRCPRASPHRVCEPTS